jgi:hypothetical protein
MTRQLSMKTRNELIDAIRIRYHGASKADKAKILDELTELTGYHRKHAIRVLQPTPDSLLPHSTPRTRHRQYDEQVRQTLILLWEAGDRICGKRLKVLIPILLRSLENHGHLSLEPGLRSKLLAISAATIDRILRKTREEIDGTRRRRVGIGSAIRRSIPVRTFSDWNDPAPGYFEVDMVEHCGGIKYDGNFVHTLVLTDIATGWTECVAMPLRDQAQIIAGFAKVALDLPFPMLGVDTENDSAFMSQMVFDYCKSHGLEQTRSRAYKKNDQAWVEQKNGAIVRRLVGYGKLSGGGASQALADLYTASRLYINYFQPSFKLKSKTRDGARVHKVYHDPMTPCDRLLAIPNVSEATKALLRKQFAELDPVRLLQDMRISQKRLADLSGTVEQIGTTNADLNSFLQSLSSAWKEGEIRPTHRRSTAKPRHWKSRVDPFEHVWPIVEQWLTAEPTVTAKEMMVRLAETIPEVYAGGSQLRTLQRRVKQWRSEQTKKLILGALQCAADRAPGIADVSPLPDAIDEETAISS